MNDHEAWLQRTRAVAKDAIQRYDAFVKQIVADRDRVFCAACNRDVCRHEDGQYCNHNIYTEFSSWASDHPELLKQIVEPTVVGRTLQRYDIRVFDACEDLHGRVTGSNDMPSEEALVAYGFLKTRLSEWQEPCSFTKEFDDTVKRLCEVVCKEYEQKYLQEDLKATKEL